MFNFRALSAATLFLAAIAASAQVSTAITTDPAPDKDNPPAIQTFAIPSHGVGLNALMYTAAGAGPHPVVILLHGFPGNEKNLDLAQSIRRAGWDVLYFDYRGSWGTPGAFSFEHGMEDVLAAIAYVRDPVNAAKLHADPKTIVLAGHSMGGLFAAWAGAHDAAIKGIVLISAADMAGRAKIPDNATPEVRKQALAKLSAGLASNGLAPLAGCTAESLAAELMAHAQEWALPGFAAKLAPRPVLIVTSDDGLAPANDALLAGLKLAGDKDSSEVHIATDHSYSGARIELSDAVLTRLAALAK